MRLYYPRRPYKVNGFRIGKHAIRQMRNRGITKSALRYNLTHRPIHTTSISYNKNGKPSYLRYSSNKIVAAINPTTNNVNTTWKFHTRLMNKFLKGGK